MERLLLLSKGRPVAADTTTTTPRPIADLAACSAGPYGCRPVRSTGGDPRRGRDVGGRLRGGRHRRARHGVAFDRAGIGLVGHDGGGLPPAQRVRAGRVRPPAQGLMGSAGAAARVRRAWWCTGRVTRSSPCGERTSVCFGGWCHWLPGPRPAGSGRGGGVGGGGPAPDASGRPVAVVLPGRPL